MNVLLCLNFVEGMLPTIVQLTSFSISNTPKDMEHCRTRGRESISSESSDILQSTMFNASRSRERVLLFELSPGMRLA